MGETTAHNKDTAKLTRYQQQEEAQSPIESRCLYFALSWLNCCGETCLSALAGAPGLSLHNMHTSNYGTAPPRSTHATRPAAIPMARHRRDTSSSNSHGTAPHTPHAQHARRPSSQPATAFHGTVPHMQWKLELFQCGTSVVLTCASLLLRF